MVERTYTTRRLSILDALADKIKTINGTGYFKTDLENNVSTRVKFWDEISDFPSVFLSAGGERREYQGGGYKDRYMSVGVRCYVHQENALYALDALLEDLETVIEENSRLKYIDKNGSEQYTHQITILTIDTDEGLLEPIGMGEMFLEVHY